MYVEEEEEEEGVNKKKRRRRKKKKVKMKCEKTKNMRKMSSGVFSLLW